MITHKNRSILFWLIAVIVLFVGAWPALPFSGQQSAAALVINEVMAANKSGLTDEDGDYSDWIELYNPDSQAINLGGWSLTDDPSQLDKWPFPDRTLPGGAYLIVFVSGKNRRSTEPDTPLHTNFRLRRQGEFLALHNRLDPKPTADILLNLPGQFNDVAYGRYQDELPYTFLTKPTPGEANHDTFAWAGSVAPVTFGVQRGFYDAPFALELTTETAGATIRYTTDGSAPSQADGLIYDGSIEISTTTPVRAVAFKADYLPSPTSTHTYIFPDGVLQQPAHPPGFPTTWGVHNRNVLAYVKGTPVIADYEMDPDVVNDPRYSPTFVDDLKSIPSLSIVTDVENLEIYANPRQRGRIWERPVSVELIDPRLYQQGFQIDAGLRLHGGVGRNEAVPKHSMRLFFRGEYGATKLEYPLFPDSPVQTFETLVLRAGTNRSYAGRYNSQHHLTTYTRDEWARRTQLAMSGVSPRGRFVHLYLNGLYWGLYNLVERPDSAFTAAYFGGQEEAWYVRDQDGSVSGSLNETVLTLILMAIEAGSAGFENPQIYSMVKSSLDTSQFSDYMILNWYIGNNDWPYNNWIAAVRNPEGRLQFFVWDAESIFKRGAEIRLQGQHGGPPTLDALRTMTALELEKEYESNPIAYVFLALMANDDFKMEFADRVFSHLFNDGALTEAKAQARWRQLNAIIDRAIVGESARWGDARYETPIVREDWLNAIDVVLAQMEGNDAKLVALMREAGYYPPIDPPAFSPHAVLVETGFELTMMAPTPDSTEIYYTTDGSDPRLEVTGQISPSAIAYRTPIVLSSTTHIKARALKGDIWSALNEATFTTAGDIGQLQITEIMYNPPGGSDYEYIELKNVGLTPVRLAGATFEGIDYTFPIATPSLASGEFIVLASNPAAFTERYPDVSLSGAFQAQLSNGGEEITLRDIQAKVIIAVNYDDELGWPISPDGLGDSLVLVSPEGDPNDPRSWRASTNLYGSPGTDDPARLARP